MTGKGKGKRKRESAVEIFKERVPLFGVEKSKGGSLIDAFGAPARPESSRHESAEEEGR